RRVRRVVRPPLRRDLIAIAGAPVAECAGAEAGLLQELAACRGEEVGILGLARARHRLPQAKLLGALQHEYFERARMHDHQHRFRDLVGHGRSIARTLTPRPRPLWSGGTFEGNMSNELAAAIDAAWEERDGINSATKGKTRDAVEAAIAGLDDGTYRTAEKMGSEWVVNQWLKKAVLLSFRLYDSVPMDGGAAFPGLGSAPWFDKVPLKTTGWDTKRFA